MDHETDSGGAGDGRVPFREAFRTWCRVALLSATAYAVQATIAGTAVIALAFPRGPKRERYGLWDERVR